ncbi:hypothetical protein AB1Y20_012642 [Prymnesium parvum]|uniref:Leucine-rich repeat-containing protein 51 n=1 Tax=Prymnesium parvum TaxID=97485 RepID=A0AB34IL43_PRYPA
MPQSQVAWLAQHVEWWNEGDHEDVTSVPVQTLDLSNRQLTHTSLQLLPDALTCLDLSRCGLEHAAALQRLPRLELLNVSYNRLTSIDDIRASKGLKVLYARSNRISSVEGLAAVRGLQSLDLECNALSSIEALAPLWRLQHLVELRLRGNLLPNYQRMCEEKLPALTSLDGVRLVECDEREASVPSFPPMPSKATSTTSLGAPPPPHALSVPRRDGAEPLTHGRPSSPPGSSVGSPERLQQLRAAHPFGLPAGDPMASCKSPSAGLATDSAVPAAHDPPPSARRHTERDDAAAFHRGARQAASPSHRALREAPAEPSSPPHRTAPPRGGGASCARAAAARSPPPATSPAEAEALRSEVVRLEKALQQAQAIRHRDVAQCARSAAHQVQELSAAIVKADRMLAESAVETERMANDMADGEQRYEAELNRMRAELSRVQAERDEAEAALHRAQLGAASFADATCPAASGGSSAPASSSVGTPVPCVHCSLATAADSGGSRRAETPDEPRGWAAVREATERELFAKSAMIERLKAQVRALMGEQQLLSRQLTDQVATLRGLSPQISTALKTRSTGKPLHSSANLDQATRAKVMMIVADVVDSELVRLEEQREQRKRHHQEMVKATSEDAQYALAAAEEEQASRTTPRRAG